LNAGQTNAGGNTSNARNGCSYKTFMASRPKELFGMKGAIGLLAWFKNIKSKLNIMKCADRSKVEFATWNEIEKYTTPFNELAGMVPHMIATKEQQAAISMAHRLTTGIFRDGEIVKKVATPETRPYAGPHPKCAICHLHYSSDCPKCTRSVKHLRNTCPRLNRVPNNNHNNNNGNAGNQRAPTRGRVHVIGAEEAMQNLTVVTVITEYLVNISKRRAFWSLNEDILKIYYSDYQYAVSIKEDMAYPCLHSPNTSKERRTISRRCQYAILKI
ncbi:hypothetical protein Tco_1374001, partial [Tanacetum coccineum]